MENVIETIVKNIETGGEFTGVLTKPSDLRDREEKIDDYAYQYAKSLWLEKHGKLPENGTDEMNDFFEFQKSLRCKFELYENGVKLPAVLKYEKGHSGQKCYLHCCSHLNEVPYAVIITYICIYANF